MLKRLYADNFRCLENFEIRFGESNLLLGRNGTGKTSVLDVLRKIQDLVVRGEKVDQVFPASDLSANHLRNEQRFEINTQSEDDSYSYGLVIEHTAARDKMKVVHEALRHTAEGPADHRGTTRRHR